MQLGGEQGPPADTPLFMRLQAELVPLAAGPRLCSQVRGITAPFLLCCIPQTNPEPGLMKLGIVTAEDSTW